MKVVQFVGFWSTRALAALRSVLNWHAVYVAITHVLNLRDEIMANGINCKHCGRMEANHLIFNHEWYKAIKAGYDVSTYDCKGFEKEARKTDAS